MWRRGVAALGTLALLASCAPADQPATEPPAAPVEDDEADRLGSEADRRPPPAVGAAPPDPGAPSAVSPPPRDEPAPDAVDDPLPDRSALRAALETLLASAAGELDAAELSVLVVDADGTELLAHEPDRPLLPASTLKLVTAAALLVTLGADARLTTSIETTAPVDEDGVVRGDLLLVGGGDPVLATPEYGRWIYPARPRTPLEALADDLVSVGVKRVSGDVRGLAPGFEGAMVAEGWRDSYFSDLNARHIAGLTVDGSLETRVRWPDDEPPDEDDDETEPTSVRVAPVEDPREHAAAELVRLLEERGVQVDGNARSGSVDHPVLGTLARIESPPLHEILRFMVQRSDNHIADTLLHVAGRVRTGEGSWERGERALLQVTDHLGVPGAGLRFTDGSGLSRDARLTASALVELDRAMVRSRHGEVWASLMAVAGEPGTLSRRLRATPAHGRLLAKTGSLRDVMSLSGFVRGDEGERYHVAVVANDATGTDRTVVRALTDDLALLLTSDLLACVIEVADDAEDGPLGRAPLAVAC